MISSKTNCLHLTFIILHAIVCYISESSILIAYVNVVNASLKISRLLLLLSVSNAVDFSLLFQFP